MTHRGTEGGRSHGGVWVDVLDDTREMTDKGGTSRGGDPGRAGETKRQ